VEWHYIAPGKPMQNGYIERLCAFRLLPGDGIFVCSIAGRAGPINSSLNAYLPARLIRTTANRFRMAIQSAICRPT
jgi:hypothetical protein